MPRRRDESPRVLGPKWISSKGYYCVTTIDPQANGGKGGRADRYFCALEEADEWKRINEERLARLEGRTIKMALDHYQQCLIQRGNKEGSWSQTMSWMRTFFQPVLAWQLTRLKADKAADLYCTRNAAGEIIGGFVVMPRPHSAAECGGGAEGINCASCQRWMKKPHRSVDYHRNVLGKAKGFLNWCKKQGWIPSNPLGEVEGFGRRNAGKAQLSGDEAWKLYEWLVWKVKGGADRRDREAALGVLMLLTMAVRSADITRRRVRDVDLGGRVLRISGGKSKASNRPRNIPDDLQSLLLTHIKGRKADELLFANGDGTPHTKAWAHSALRRFCKEVGVPTVCPHSLKGVAGNALADAGENPNRVKEYLSHTESSTSERHYLRPGALEDAQTERGLSVFAERMHRPAVSKSRVLRERSTMRRRLRPEAKE